MAASEQREKLVDFSNPLYDKAKGIIVSGPGAPPVSRLEDLSGKEVYLPKNTVPFEKLSQLSENFKKEGKAAITLTPADENLLDDDVLEMVNAGLVPMTVSEDRLAQFWVKVLPRLQLHRDIMVAEGPLAWAMQKNTPQLKAVVNEFIETHRVGTAFGNTIGRKYLRDIKWVKDATGREDLARFEQMVKLFVRTATSTIFRTCCWPRRVIRNQGWTRILKAVPGQWESCKSSRVRRRQGPSEFPIYTLRNGISKPEQSICATW